MKWRLCCDRTSLPLPDPRADLLVDRLLGRLPLVGPVSGQTPGPWHAGPSEWPDQLCISPESCIVTLAHVHNYPKEMEANARLIAAAPDLLEAAKDVARLVPGAHKRLKAAIAKAEGR
jgi:hypothetical protein